MSALSEARNTAELHLGALHYNFERVVNDGSTVYVPGTNSSGFSALPSGNRGDNEIFYYAGRYAGFWSSSENGPEGAYTMRLSYGNAEANLRYGNKYDGFSIRCVKD